MFGIYIHVPFCKTRCTYCDFHSSVENSAIDLYVNALRAEISSRRDFKKGEKVRTLYFGGGTPSLLNEQDLAKIFAALNENFDFEENAEITFECNPDDLSAECLKNLTKFPINRLSLGVQSFNDEELKNVNRRHTASQAKTSVKRAVEAGFGNISIDLIIGLPGQNFETLSASVGTAISLGVQHVSAYLLSVEEGTALWRQWQENSVSLADENALATMFSAVCEKLAAAGLEHYEISNFAKNGFVSRHNSAYWDGTPYLGLGSGAHSFDGEKRRWNVASVQKYINSALKKSVEFEEEILTNADIFNEKIMLGLRTAQGVDLQTIAPEFRAFCLEKAETFILQGILQKTGERISLTKKGILLADAVIREMIYV